MLERRRPSMFEPALGSVPLVETRDDVALRETAAEIDAEKPANVRPSRRLAAAPAAANATETPSSLRDRSRNTARKESSPIQPNAVLASKSNRRAAESAATIIAENHVEVAPREEPGSSRDRATIIALPELNSPPRLVETRIEKEVVSVVKEKDSRFEAKDRGNAPSPRPQPSTVTPPGRRPKTKPDVETRIETRVEKHNEPLVPRQNLKSPSITSLPQLPVARVPSRRPAAPSLSAPVPPTIQVTIGRVEVRATAAAPAKPARPSARPTLSLEDYLRARSGESR